MRHRDQRPPPKTSQGHPMLKNIQSRIQSRIQSSGGHRSTLRSPTVHTKHRSAARPKNPKGLGWNKEGEPKYPIKNSLRNRCPAITLSRHMLLRHDATSESWFCFEAFFRPLRESGLEKSSKQTSATPVGHEKRSERERERERERGT